MTPPAKAQVRLRPLRRDDAAHTLAWRNDTVLRESQLGYCFPITAEMEAAWFDERLNDRSGRALIFAIEDCSDDAFVGYVTLTDMDWIARVAELGISIGERTRHGRGLGSGALTAMLDHGFNTLNLDRIWVRVAAFNQGALCLFESAGFVREGLLRRHVFVAGGHHDLVVMGLLRSQWRHG